MSKEEHINNILDNGYFRLGSVVAVCLFCCGLVWEVAKYKQADAVWKVGMERDVEGVDDNRKGLMDVKVEVALANKKLDKIALETSDRFPRKSMRIWGARTEELNPGWEAANVDEIP